MPKGDSFTAPPATDTPDPSGFDLRAWIAGAAPVTRSCTVYGRPDLMGEIEALKDELVEAPPGLAIAQRIEDLREQMHASAVRFRFRGLRNGELEAIREEMGRPDDAPDGVGELDYRIMAAQCVAPAGLGWEDFRDLHTNFGAYFSHTILKTSVQAVQGGGVDVPFSSASSALIARSTTS